MTETILGIHSNVKSGNKSGGHAWITVTTRGKTSHYGLWPDDHPDVVDNGDGTDIREGMESFDRPAASRYYKLTDTQIAELNGYLGHNITWKLTNNCSSWASYVVLKVVGEDVDADDNWALGMETPRELGRNIALLEAKSPTAYMLPKDMTAAKIDANPRAPSSKSSSK